MLNNTDCNTNCASQCNDNTVCNSFTAKTANSKQDDGSFMKGKLVHKNAEKSSSNVVKQCQLANKLKRETSVSNGNISNDTRCNFAGESKVTDHLSKHCVRRRHEAVICETDQYELDLRVKPRHRDIIASAGECNTFKNLNDQNHDKFGFIPLGDLTFPPIELKKYKKEKIFDIHRRIKVSGVHNYMKCQIQIQSQLKPDVWQKYLTNYWDSQLVLLLRYGFPFDIDHNSPLESVEENHSSANQYKKMFKFI